MTADRTDLYSPDRDDLILTDVLHALSDPVRLDLVRQLASGERERSCGSFDVAIAQSTATHHWRVLRECGVVSSRAEGTKKFQRLRREDLDARFPGLLASVLAHADA